jgi:thiamine-phosphate pyrophosphorylase
MLPVPAKPLPSGVWAIASHLEAESLPNWMANAAAASAWTFRLPKARPDQVSEMLQKLRAEAPWLAIHADWDWAIACQADAIIAGSRSLSLTDLRSAIQSQCAGFMQLGYAAHSQDEVQTAIRDGAEFAFFSPIWDTPSKAGILKPRGCEALRTASQKKLPLIALGGIQTPQQVAECQAAGAHGVAVLRAATDAGLLREMQAAWHQA